MKFSIRNFFSNGDQIFIKVWFGGNPEEIFNGKFHYLSSVMSVSNVMSTRYKLTFPVVPCIILV